MHDGYEGALTGARSAQSFRIPHSAFRILLALAAWLAPAVATLASLKQVDEHPLYTMRYYGAYEGAASSSQVVARLFGAALPRPDGAGDGPPPRLRGGWGGQRPAWACALFAALGDGENMFYGRGFDWEYSPAILLFTDPPDGYASVSMVDFAYLGFASPTQARGLLDLPLTRRAPLLNAPFMPFDGMNEQGLAVGMAAVPASQMPRDPRKETIGSLQVIRELLDHAANVDQAVALMQRYNVDVEGGPALHYLIADSTGRAVLVEFYQGEMVVIPNEAPWHLATNFLRTAVGDNPQSQCPRYAHIYERLAAAQGRITPQEAMEILKGVAQPSTQWSIVYGMSRGEVEVVMGKKYEEVHELRLWEE